MINVFLKDQATLDVMSTGPILNAIDKEFSYRADGYKWDPRFIRGVWDGIEHLFNPNDGKLPAGLFNKLAAFAQRNSIPLQFDSNANGLQLYNNAYIDPTEYIKSLKITGNDGTDIFPKDYQLASVEKSINHKRVTVQSPTGSGKSLVIYLMTRWFMDNVSPHRNGPGADTLIVVPNISLVEQLQKDFADYSQLDPTFDADAEVHKIHSGAEKTTDKKIVITTWQSINKLGPQWFKRFGLYIGDEVHKFKANCLRTITKKMVNADFRMGTTGTINPGNASRMIVMGSFGPTFKATSTDKLIDDGTLAPLDIEIHKLKYAEWPFPEEEVVEEASLGAMFETMNKYTYAHEERNNYIANLVKQQTQNTLVLTRHVKKHGEPLRDIIQAACPDKKVYLSTGSTPVEVREEIRANSEKNDNIVIVASYQIFSTGINIKNLHNIVFAASTKSYITTIQSIGRGLRKLKDNKTKVYDIVDVFPTKINFLANHGKTRQTYYDKEKFRTNIININISS